MTTGFIDIKFYIVHCLFMVVMVEAKKLELEVCVILREPRISLLYNYN